LLFAQECRFVAGTETIDRLPPMVLPEIAFAGRSNVGKSSLVNALTGRNTLARVSNTPGRTRQINFFDLGRRLMLVDLPGYGYAKVSRDTVDRWVSVLTAYLKGRAGLRRILLLVDSRHGLKDSDRQLMGILDTAAVNYQLVMTKVDKSTMAELAICRSTLADKLATRPASHPEIFLTSARDGLGIAELRAELATMALSAAERK
jgi:GTP-binding protein